MEASSVVDVLAVAPIFDALGRPSLEALVERSGQRVFPGGTVIFEEGEEGHEAFVVLEGTVRISHRQSVLALFSVGEVFGEMAVLDGMRRSATATADTEVCVLAIDRASFLEVVGQDTAALGRLLTQMSHRLRDTSSRLAEAERIIDRYAWRAAVD